MKELKDRDFGAHDELDERKNTFSEDFAASFFDSNTRFGKGLFLR